MKKIIQLILLVVAVVPAANGQGKITLQQAIEIGMKNNFDIRISKNASENDKVNNTLGNAGMLPTISVSATGSVQTNNQSQLNRDGSNSNYPSLNTTNVSTGIQLNWLLFDGGKMFVTKSKLNEIEQLGQLSFKNQVLTSMYNIIEAYYNIASQQMQLKTMGEVLKYNTERLKISQAGLLAGTLMKPDVLQAQMDENMIKESIIEQEFQIRLSKRNLNILLGRDAAADFDVNDSIAVSSIPDKETILSQINNKNTNIQALQTQTEIDRKTIKEAQSSYLPSLNIKAGYYYSRTDNSEGAVVNNHYKGPQALATLSIPIFNAGETQRKVKLAKIALQNSDINLEQLRITIRNEVENAYKDVDNQQKLLEIETANYELVKENLAICLQRFGNGQATSLEIHQAQENYVQSFSRLFTFRYNLKMAETRIKQLIADL